MIEHVVTIAPDGQSLTLKASIKGAFPRNNPPKVEICGHVREYVVEMLETMNASDRRDIQQKHNGPAETHYRIMSSDGWESVE